MLAKFEISGFIFGTLSCVWMLVLILNYQSVPDEVFEWFRGGNTGGVVIGVLMAFGFISVLLLPINLIIGNRKIWLIRVALCVGFVFSSAFLGSYV
jgi:hypothetical protein|tara:strand:- start:49 stop:336 length:288 start_codon:yes stop_codon:yes gene_type:complete